MAPSLLADLFKQEREWMDALPPEPSGAAAAPARPAPSRRALWIGSLLAIVVMAALAGLAWSLTRPSGAAGSGAASAAGGGPGGPGGPGGGAGRRPPASTVGIASAETADLPVTLEARGTVTPAATVTVRPQVSGVLKELKFREGQMVKAGEQLAQIDPRPFEMALMQALGQRQRDEAQLENARLTLQRYRTLLQQDSIARQDVDTQTGTVRAKARFANTKFSLFPSQFVNVQLLLRTVQGAVVVPVNALRHGTSGDYVFVLNEADHTVAQRPVTRGIATADKVQVASGLAAGEKIITEGADRLKDGARVVLPGDRPASGAASSARRGARGARGADGASWPGRRRASDAATQ